MDAIGKKNVVIEVATDAEGKVLWVEEYAFNRLQGLGEYFVRANIEYKVLDGAVTQGNFGTRFVEHVVEKTVRTLRCPFCHKQVEEIKHHGDKRGVCRNALCRMVDEPISIFDLEQAVINQTVDIKEKTKK